MLIQFTKERYFMIKEIHNFSRDTVSGRGKLGILLAISTLLLSTLAYADQASPFCAPSSLTGTYSLGPGNDGNQATGTGPFHLTATNSTFSYVQFSPSIVNNPNVSFTFAQLTSLFANFQSNSGGSGGGTPRLSVHLFDSSNVERRVLIFLGNSPSFTDSDTALNAYSGFNVIGNNDSGRYDTSAFSGGSPFTTYSAALALVGTNRVGDIFYVTDTFGSFPSRDETLFSIGGSVNSCDANNFFFLYFFFA